MGVIAKNHRQIVLYYNSDTLLGRQTYAYVKSSRKKLLAIDLSRAKVTATQWVEIADSLNLKVSELINTGHPDFIKNYGIESLVMVEHDWLKLLEKQPEVLSYPIVINGTQFLQIRNPSDFVKFM